LLFFWGWHDQGEVEIMQIDGLHLVDSTKCLIGCKANKEVDKMTKLGKKICIKISKGNLVHMVVPTSKELQWHFSHCLKQHC
jgi:hypothetical protein